MQPNQPQDQTQPVMQPANMPAGPQLTQPAPPAVAEEQLQPAYMPGQQVFALRPTVGAGWEPAIIEADPANTGRLIVAFQDNTRFYADDVQISGPVATDAVEPDTANAAPAPAEPLKPDYATIRQVIVQLDARCQQIFDMPLDMLITQVHRTAVQHELTGSGRMQSVSGLSQFTPDSQTLEAWFTKYLLIVQERERQAAGASAE